MDGAPSSVPLVFPTVPRGPLEQLLRVVREVDIGLVLHGLCPPEARFTVDEEDDVDFTIVDVEFTIVKSNDLSLNGFQRQGHYLLYSKNASD